MTDRSRTVLVTFLGSVVRRMGSWMPIAGTVDLMGQCGLDGPGVRTAVSRLKKRGWLESAARDGTRGYSLTDDALAALADGDEVIWHARRPADLADGWCVVNFSVPEADRTRRHQLRAHLAALGFGNVGTATWIAPARMAGGAERAIAELDLAAYSAVFVGDHVGGQSLGDLLARSWDLAAIDERYREFIARFDGALGRPTAAEAFATYLTLVDHWRRLPYRDPGLPLELLPRGWSGPAAVALFERTVARLERPALEHAGGYWG